MALGMVPVIGARRGSVRWLAACLTWPALLELPEVPVVGNHIAAVTLIRSETDGARPRQQRIVLVRRRERPDVFVAALEAWLHAYRSTRVSDRDPTQPDPTRPPFRHGSRPGGPRA